MNRHDRSGFTFAEVLVVLIVISILAGIMVMRYIELKHRAVSAQATSDMENVRIAAFSKFYDTGVWPTPAGTGVVPPELVSYLGTGFTFNRSDYKLEFENFVPPGGGTTASYQVGIRLTTSNTGLIATLAQTVGTKAPYIMIGNDLVVVLVGPDGET